MDERFGVTEDYFDAVLVADGIAVRMSDNVALILTQLAGRLVRFLETGEVEWQGRRATAPDKMLRRLFPDAYRNSAAARAFRDRHAAVLTDSNAPRLVHARCGGGTEHVIAHAEVDDWLVTLGLARFLTTARDARTVDMTDIWINHMQECLVTAVDPRLASLPMEWAPQPRTIRRDG
ncbi:DUF2017 family protein [Actinophytocola sp.]|uniref:DUF2017 family protein n=1 Tax=Actinophytocola sp. TaxID=1872138 RepID=UPI002D6D282D|nr:DUF2017 family protein [Actinophytocola sp.]HYQ68584.1 DUF2017 family protein [Actinophytocola sp.]